MSARWDPGLVSLVFSHWIESYPFHCYLISALAFHLSTPLNYSKSILVLVPRWYVLWSRLYVCVFVFDIYIHRTIIVFWPSPFILSSCYQCPWYYPNTPVWIWCYHIPYLLPLIAQSNLKMPIVIPILSCFGSLFTLPPCLRLLWISTPWLYPPASINHPPWPWTKTPKLIIMSLPHNHHSAPRPSMENPLLTVYINYYRPPTNPPLTDLPIISPTQSTLVIPTLNQTKPTTTTTRRRPPPPPLGAHCWRQWLSTHPSYDQYQHRR